LEGKLAIGDPHRARVDKCVYVIRGDEEQVISGDEPDAVLIEALFLQIGNGRPSSGGSILTGTPASGGRVSGTCRVIIRPDDADRKGFRAGDILVSESTDMDLEELMRRAGGVITEAGGATCHAAIICRELGKPAIVGVKDAIKWLADSQYVVLDADEGTVSIQSTEPGKVAVDCTTTYTLGASTVGTKAWNLARMSRANIDVPPFFSVPIQQLAKALGNSTSDSVGPERQDIALEIERELKKLNGDLFVLRSSMASEDLPDDSQAGRWPTELGVSRQDVAGLVFRYWEWLAGQGFGNEAGSLIVEEMVLGDASGVFMTKDPREGNSGNALLEIVPGGNELLTDGQINPVRYLIDRATHNLTFVEDHGHLSRYVSESAIRRLVEICHRLEGIFGEPQDIEWTVEGDDIKILQSRPITALRVGATSRAPLRTDPIFNSFSALYRALKVPPNLQKHLLRVASVGEVICENWSGPAIDRELILGTLLVHDIGNIVKADYDKFPALYPEEMKNIRYWRSVQANMRRKYGDDDVEASINIAKEIGASSRILALLRQKQFVNNIQIELSDDFNVKIAAYADQRVAFYGVLSLEERLAEAKRRYRGVPYASVNKANFDELVAAIIRVETQLQAHTSVDIQLIDDESIASHVDKLGAREWTMLSLESDRRSN
jgi:phosphohistidine swiveling domain-containing protein